jgi:hypothetical protein
MVPFNVLISVVLNHSVFVFTHVSMAQVSHKFNVPVRLTCFSILYRTDDQLDHGS